MYSINLILIKQIVPSTYHLQKFILLRFEISGIANSIMKMSPNQKTTLSVTGEMNILETKQVISFWFNDVFNSYLVYILLRTMHIVFSNGTLINKDLSPNNIIWNPSGILLWFLSFLDCTVLLLFFMYIRINKFYFENGPWKVKAKY